MKITLAIYVLLYLIGLHFYSDGFFITKKQETEISLGGTHQSQVKSVIYLIIDALRYDFADFNISREINSQNENYINHFPVFRKTQKDNPDHTVILRSFSDPPTVTMQRIRALITGGLQSFIEVKNNLFAHKLS